MDVVEYFDGNNKIIQLLNQTPISVKDIYSDWKRWVIDSDNSKYEQAFKYVGGDPTLPGQFLGSTFFLINNWKIRPSNNDQNLVVDGNLFTDDQSAVFIPTVDVHTVAIQNAFSNLTTIIDNQLSIPTPEENASAVWQKNSSDTSFEVENSIGYFTKTVLIDEVINKTWNKPIGSFLNLDELGLYMKSEIQSVITSAVWSAMTNNNPFNINGSIGDFIFNVLPTSSTNVETIVNYDNLSAAPIGSLGYMLYSTKQNTDNIPENVVNQTISGAPSGSLGSIITDINDKIDSTPEATANKVWSYDISNSIFDIPSSIGNFIKNKVLSVAKYLASK